MGKLSVLGLLALALSCGALAQTKIQPVNGGTGQDTSASNGCPVISAGVWSVSACHAGTVTAVSVTTANGFQGSSSGGATPALTINVDSTHVLPTNTGSSTSYLNAAGGYSVPTGGYTLPIATTSTLGGVKSDGATVSVDGVTGILSCVTATNLQAGCVLLGAAGGTDTYGSATTAQSNAELYASNASNISTGTIGSARLPSVVPLVVADSDVLGQTTSQSTVTLIGSVGSSGKYRISYYANENALCTTGYVTVLFTFNWSDPISTRSAQSVTLTMADTQSAPFGAIQGIVPIYADASTAVTYTSTVTGSCTTGGPASYDIHVSVESVQ